MKLIKLATKIKVIVNRKENISSVNNVYVNTSDAMKLIIKALKNATAKKIIDNDETLMYIIESI
jgi:hypothetical protein